MQKKMDTRTLNADELEQLLDLYVHLHNEEPPEKELAKSVWKQIMDMPGMTVWGVFAEDQLVASCLVNIIPNLTHEIRPYALIENVVTHRDHRRKGYGQQVIEAAINHARRAGCYKVMLSTSSKNPGTWAFYERCGFDGHHKRAFVKLLY